MTNHFSAYTTGNPYCVVDTNNLIVYARGYNSGDIGNWNISVITNETGYTITSSSISKVALEGHTHDRVNGIKTTVSSSAPSSPQTNDIWIDTSA